MARSRQYRRDDEHQGDDGTPGPLTPGGNRSLTVTCGDLPLQVEPVGVSEET